MRTISSETLKVIINDAVGKVGYRLKKAEHKVPKKHLDALRAMGIHRIYKEKLGYAEIIVGRKYSNAVNGKRLLEGQEMDFVAMAPSGKEFIDNSAVIARGNTANTLGTEYVCGQPTGTESTTKWVDQDGRELCIKEPSAENVEMPNIRFIFPPSYFNTSSGRQGVDDENRVLWATPKVENITALRVEGVEYEVV